jgi:hypothetical protein
MLWLQTTRHLLRNLLENARRSARLLSATLVVKRSLDETLAVALPAHPRIGPKRGEM